MSTTITTTSVQGQSDSSSSSNNILHLFPEVDPGLATSTTSTEAAPNDDLNGYDEEQVRLMDEVCIVVDQNDRPVGSASKRVCMSPLLTGVSDPSLINVYCLCRSSDEEH